jgi:hypothetical protein
VERLKTFAQEICGANEDQLRNLCCVFLCFEAISRLKINLPKSKIIPIGEVVDVDRQDYL